MTIYMSDDKDIIIFVSSTTGSLAARAMDTFARVPNKTVATPYPGDIEKI